MKEIFLLFPNVFKFQGSGCKSKCLFIICFLVLTSSVSAQDIIFNVKTYKGGYNISCNGSSNGLIDATIVGGVPPYTYSWSNSVTTQDLTNIPAGSYTLTVTDALSHQNTKSTTLFEPDAIDVFLNPSVYDGGYNISKMGGNDGYITTDVKGGVPPYSYLWNTGSKKANIDKLVAGIYSVTITDQNGCIVTKSITMLQPSNSGDKNGNVSDNTNFVRNTNNTPLIFKIANTEKLRIAENGNVGIGTNNPQSKLEVNGDALMNGNIKAVGSITFGTDKEISYAPASGTTPASYGWGIPNSARGPVLALSYCLSPSTPPPSAINIIAGMAHFYGYNRAGQLNVLRTGFDGANGIIDLAGITNPRLLLNYYCGKDVDVCTGINGGNIHLTSSALGMVGIGIDNPAEKLDVKGNIAINNNDILLRDHHHGLGWYGNDPGTGISKPFTSTSGENIDGPVLYGWGGGALGSKYYVSAGTDIKTIALRWSQDGKVCIGIDPSLNMKGYKLAVNGVIGAKELVLETALTPWPDYVFAKNYKLRSLKDLEQYIINYKHLPELPEAKDVEHNGIKVGETNALLLKKIEELTLYIIEQNKRIEALEKK